MPKRRIKGGKGLAVDTETTGLDFHHGSRPFMVSAADTNNNVMSWEWDVDPKTRMPIYVESDLDEILEEINSADYLVFQNATFDIAAFKSIPNHPINSFDWWKIPTVDTLLSGHLLGSNLKHDLTSMAIQYLGISIDKYDSKLTGLAANARRLAKSKDFIAKHGEWAVARNDDFVNAPSNKGKSLTKLDSWLVRAVAEAEGYEEGSEWRTVCRDYAEKDAEVTLVLGLRHLEIIKKRKLEKIYEERLKILPILDSMKFNGITVSSLKSEKKISEFSEKKVKLKEQSESIAENMGFQLSLPKAGNNAQLIEFAESNKGLNLVPIAKAKSTGLKSPVGKSSHITLNRDALERYELVLSEEYGRKDKRSRFVRNLMEYRRLATAITYLESYRRFWQGDGEWKVLRPSLNPTGTNTLRWSSQNPSEQNISKQEGYSLREVFGPTPGREWWSMDAKNIELRIPAYVSNERQMIELFENGDSPPYYGSYHLMIFDTLHPKLFSQFGKECKKKFASSWYQWTKNGNFAVQYGAVEDSGTADRAYHVQGAHRRIKERFKNIDYLSKKILGEANRRGYIETIPDTSVDPDRGYPLLCARDQYGRIKPTVPFNYYIQGSAMRWMTQAMLRCDNYLKNVSEAMGEEYKMIIQVHDELVFDFPCKPNKGNRHIANDLRKLMEQGGSDIGVVTPVGMEYHLNNWSDGETVEAE